MSKEQSRSLFNLKINFRSWFTRNRDTVGLWWLFVLSRVYQLGFDVLNTDAPNWKVRIYKFSSALAAFDFAGTNITYHPGIPLIWLGAAAIKAHHIYYWLLHGIRPPDTHQTFFELHFFQKLFVVIFIGFFLALSYHFLKKLIGRRWAFFWFILLLVEPYFVALTRVLHTDGMVAALSFAAVITLYQYLFGKGCDRRLLYLSGATAGLAFLTKSNALFLVLFSGLMFLAKWNFGRRRLGFKRIFRDGLGWSAAAFLVFFLLWPSMWVTPLATLKNYYYGIAEVGVGGGHGQELFGVKSMDPGLGFYPISLLIRTSPWFLAAYLLGLVIYLRGGKKARKDLAPMLRLSSFFIVGYLAFLALPSKKLERYTLPIYPFAALVASFGLVWLLEVLPRRYPRLKERMLLIGFSSLLFIFSFLSVFGLAPDYLAYYTPLVGGLRGGREIIDTKWPLGYRKLGDYLNLLPGAAERRVLVRYGYLFDRFYDGPVGFLDQPDGKDPGTWFAAERPGHLKYFENKVYELRKVLDVAGVDYYWIYEIIGEKTGEKR